MPSGAGAAGSPASDPALALPRVAEAMRAFFVLVSSPEALPEFQAIQVRLAVHGGQTLSKLDMNGSNAVLRYRI